MPWPRTPAGMPTALPTSLNDPDVQVPIDITLEFDTITFTMRCMDAEAIITLQHDDWRDVMDPDLHAEAVKRGYIPSDEDGEVIFSRCRLVSAKLKDTPDVQDIRGWYTRPIRLLAEWVRG